MTLLTIPRQGHLRPNAAWFEKGIAALSTPAKSGRAAHGPGPEPGRAPQSPPPDIRPSRLPS